MRGRARRLLPRARPWRPGGCERAGGAGCRTPAVYDEPADDGKTAPDVRRVTLNDNGNGTLGVVVDMAPDEMLTDAEVDLYLDADRNPATGQPGRRRVRHLNRCDRHRRRKVEQLHIVIGG